ncbi:MAG: metallophosphoesterase family protein, partial [Akkermansiaceae bacterium]|nr:metallophosphoesterase family protein [Akkermansiaceae bacterium]
GSTHRVLYGTDPKNLDQAQTAQKNGQHRRDRRGREKNLVPDYFHHAHISGLKPDTNYHFVLESDGKRSRQLYFRTAPAGGTDFTIIHGGDSRSGHAARCKMNLLLAVYARDPKVLCFAHGGDFIDSGGRWSHWRLWLSQHELTTAPDGRVLPIIPTFGNHDGGREKTYFDVFGLEEKTQKTHVTHLGKDVAIITLDTNGPASEQADWLEKQLSTLRPKTKWLLVQYHRPMYPAVKKPARHAPIFVPLFEKYNIDIALESDGHCMKRTVPIRDGKKDPTGIVYVGEGGLGVNQRRPDPARWYFDQGGKVGRGHHVMRLDLSDDALRCRFILMDGKTWDDITIKPRS